MKRLVEFPLDQGGSVVIEVDDPPGAPVTRGLGKDRSALVEKADKTFEDATAAVTLAHWTGQAGDPTAARDQFAALLPVREQVLGARHPDTVATREQLDRWTGRAAG
jgi:hypothetical protein